MKLSADHFQHLEESIEDGLRDSRSLGLTALGGFGLLPFSSLDLQNARGSSPQSVRVIINSCRAILPGGYRIEILPENIQSLQLPAKAPFVEFVPSQGIRYHLYLSVNEKKRIPSGIPLTRPIRHPHLVPEYQLEAVAHDRMAATQNLAPNRMKVAEWQNGKILEGYIPPCLTIKGFNLLERWLQFFQNQLENIARLSIQVVNEHRAKEVTRATFCLPIVQYIRGTQGYFKYVLPNQSPLYLIAYFTDLAGLIESLLETGDRDFVRNRLKNGQVNSLLACIHALSKPRSVPLEEIAYMISLTKRFCEALYLTVKGLQSISQQHVKHGDA